MTDLLTENARLRAALEAMLHRHILYCGGESMAFAGHTDVALFQEARAALATPAPDAVQEAARFLAEAIDKDMQTFNRSLTAVDLSPDMPVRHFFSRALVAYADTLRAIAGGRT